MRLAIAILAVSILGLASAAAQADPYRWCAQYGGRGGGGATNCYFMTEGQCRAAVSGVGGFCRPNPFYTGPRSTKRRTRR
jgi:hypothetical protein